MYCALLWLWAYPELHYDVIFSIWPNYTFMMYMYILLLYYCMCYLNL